MLTTYGQSQVHNAKLRHAYNALLAYVNGSAGDVIGAPLDRTPQADEVNELIWRYANGALDIPALWPWRNPLFYALHKLNGTDNTFAF